MILSPVAIYHGYFSDTEDPDEEHINERVHWSVIEKREARTQPAYTPRNLPAEISTEKIAAITDQERALLSRSE